MTSGGSPFRIGHGFDVHPFTDQPDRALVLGGVTITGPGSQGLVGHSDADAVAHALADAVLGAAGLGDLGRHAPDTDPQWNGADSLAILARMVELAAESGWAPVNADCTVVAERPRLAPHVGLMSERLGGGARRSSQREGHASRRPRCPGPGRGDRLLGRRSPRAVAGHGAGLTPDRRGSGAGGDGRRRGAGAKRGGSRTNRGSAGRRPAGDASRGGGRRSAPARRQDARPGRPALGPGRRPASRGLGGDQVEGRQAVRELLRADRRSVRSLLMADDMEPSAVLDDIEALASKRRVRVEYVSRRRLDSVARTDGSQGVVALARPIEESPLDALCTASGRVPLPFLVVLDGITDPHNVGALLRSAECAGVTGAVLPRHRSAHLSPTVAKVAAGAIEYLPIALVPGVPAALRQISERGVWTIGMVGEARQSFYELPLGDQPVALVLGSEDAGLGALTRKRCDVLASLPQHGTLSSLNVSTAGAIACFEVARRRSEGRAPGSP